MQNKHITIISAQKRTWTKLRVRMCNSYCGCALQCTETQQL